MSDDCGVPLVGRFAPSPTSQLHLGNLRTALAAWLLARAPGGRFLVRVEDLDTARVRAAGAVAQQQLHDLARIGLDWDDEVIYQSQRQQLYAEAVASLGERVYPCFCTRKEIAEAASAPHDGFRAYPGTCARLSSVERAQRALSRTPALRVRAAGAEYSISDLHAGIVTGHVDDFVLRRNDGTFAYNLAVVVDDGWQQVTQVVRGQDLASSAPRQAWLAATLGFRVPEYAHVSLVLGPHGNRLAKRDGAVTLDDFPTADPGRAQRWLNESLGLPGVGTPNQLLTQLPANFAGTPQWWRPVVFA